VSSGARVLLRQPPDADGDGEGNLCDTDDGLIFVTATGPYGFAWQEEDGFDSWNAYTGDLVGLLAGGSYTQEPGALSARPRAHWGPRESEHRARTRCPVPEREAVPPRQTGDRSRRNLTARPLQPRVLSLR